MSTLEVQTMKEELENRIRLRLERDRQRGAGRRLSDDEIAEILELYGTREDLSVRAIAERFGVTPKSIMYHVRKQLEAGV